MDTKHCGKIIQVAAAGSKCAILNEKGQVYVWGFGILGKGPKLYTASVPEMIPETIFGCNEINPDSHVTSITAGVNHFIAITNTHDVYSWGKNTRGCLGLQSEKDQYFPLKVAMPAETHTVACGVDHTVALSKSWC
ncbi:hypothetical protein FSP39_005223 [Pinctada imbricata]|uniref:Uncharacterized protein n=1 Tax=Pinctada imbricata TaxID=66713 RepID=A0AA88XQD5_PINIB|nr:hypothetical protein FSP39_005223 [Pinctada imbricata]